MDSFNNLGLKKEIVSVLSTLNFKKPLEVQKKIIPVAITGKNVVFTSRTGSGKTLAYLLGYISKINPKQGLQMLVIIPTRELCIQVGKEMTKVCEPLGINVGMLYGGRSITGDNRTISKKNQILAATPGRIIQHINETKIKVGDVKYIVFDESDQMFDNGFYKDCKYLKKRISTSAQLILCSATITDKVTAFINEQIVNYELFRIGTLLPEQIDQEKVFCEKTEKNDLLDKVFSRRFKRAIVFTNTKVKTISIADHLAKKISKIRVLSSDFEQIDRLNTLNLFKEGKVNVLVTTDIAARGLHIENIDIIVNYDAPTRSEFYIHRIGRTARGDCNGYAITFICPEDVERFRLIEEEFNLKVQLVDKDLKKVTESPALTEEDKTTESKNY